MRPRLLCKQQYIYLGLAIVSICLAGASMVFAEEVREEGTVGQERKEQMMEARGTGDARSEEARMQFDARAAFSERMSERQAQLQEKRAQIQQRIAERRAALSEEVQQRVSRLAGDIVMRLEGAIERIGALADRIEERAVQLSERGVDTSEARAHLEDARQALSDASAALADIDVDIEYAVTSEDPRADWQEAKEQFRAVYGYMGDARESLRKAVVSLKGMAAMHMEARAETT